MTSLQGSSLVQSFENIRLSQQHSFSTLFPIKGKNKQPGIIISVHSTPFRLVKCSLNRRIELTNIFRVYLGTFNQMWIAGDYLLHGDNTQIQIDTSGEDNIQMSKVNIS